MLESTGSIHSMKIPDPTLFEEGLSDPNQIKKPTSTNEHVHSKDYCPAAPAVSAEQPNKQSWWDRLRSFLWKTSSSNNAQQIQGKSDSLDLLSPIPTLETPKIPYTWSPQMNKKTATEPLPSLAWIKEGLSTASCSTIEEVIFIVLKGQLEMEKEVAELADKGFKYQEQAKLLKDKILEEVEKALARDHKIAGYFKKAQYLTLAAGVFSALAIAVTFAPPSALGLGTTATAAMKHGIATLNLLNGFKTALDTYFKSTANQNKASFATARHERGMHQFEMDEMRQHLTTIADNNHSFRESWQREVKRITKTIRNILRK